MSKSKTRNTSSRNPAVRSMVETDGEEATKEYIGRYYGFNAMDMSWPEIDKQAEMRQQVENQKWRDQQTD